MSFKVLLCPLLFLLAWQRVHSVAVICYYASWTAYHGMVPETFDPHLCTHINYAFVGMMDNGNLKAFDQYLDINLGLYKRVTALKKRNPKLKVLLSVGGASADSTRKFSSIARDWTKIRTFVASALHFISTFNFDGLDVDWEYPTAAEKGNFITLLRELKNAFQPKGLLLAAAVAAIPSNGYDIPKISTYLDIINLMTYDFYGAWSTYTGQNSPLFASSIETQWQKENLNVAASANNWLRAGAPKHKLAIGTAFYGRSFTLKNTWQHGLHAPINGAGNDGGIATYSAICTKYNGWTRVWDNQQKNPYRYQGNQWIGYDDKDSIWAKGAWIKNQGFFGAMVWTIDGDDVKGQCGEKQILLKQLNRSIKTDPVYTDYYGWNNDHTRMPICIWQTMSLVECSFRLTTFIHRKTKFLRIENRYF